MEVIEQLIATQSQAFAKRFEDLVIGRLNELGYETADRKKIAERCHVLIKLGSNLRELWIDKDTGDQKLIALYTDPVSKIEEVKGVYTGTIEFTFTPTSTEE